MPKDEKYANSWMAAIRLTNSDDRPAVVVRTAKAVGRDMEEKLDNIAVFASSPCFSLFKNSEQIYRQ